MKRPDPSIQQHNKFALDGAQTQHPEHQRVDASRPSIFSDRGEAEVIGKGKTTGMCQDRFKGTRHHVAGQEWETKHDASFGHVRQVHCPKMDARLVYVKAEQRESQLWKQHGIAHSIVSQ